MRKYYLVLIFLIAVVMSACEANPPTPLDTPVAHTENMNATEPAEAIIPTETVAPTDIPSPIPVFVTPQDGIMLDYEEMYFQVDPLPGAEGYSWKFIQNSQVLWETIKNEQRLTGAEYSVPTTGSLIEKFTPGELQVQVTARIKGRWTDPGMITVYLGERLPTITSTSIPTATLPPLAEGPVEIRWFVGLGTGTFANQQDIQRNVVRKFNEAHPNIKLTLQVVDYGQARDILAEQIRNGTAPDIVGPMGWGASNAFHDVWFDLSALIVDTEYDLSVFDPKLVESYRTDEGQIGLPFSVYPAAVFYNRSLFDRTQIAYPPKAYGELYTMPDGSQVEWNWDTLAEVARLLTLDAQGRNATDPVFDSTHIYQYGFVPQYQDPTHFATFWSANKLYDEDDNAVIPPVWKTAWEWYYNGMWGKQPFIPNQPAINTPRFGSGNPFSTANVAMAITQSWYIGPNLAGGQQWDFGALPAYEGVVHGRIDADTFRIWEGTPHPREAFEVLAYFLGPASTDLLRAYGGIPARIPDQDAFFAARAQQYYFVKNWDVLKAGLDYPDIPSAEGYMPNFSEAWNRLSSFGILLRSNDTLSLEAEIETLRIDLNNIFKR